MGCAQPEKVIFDTDCAYFNDDGAALVMLLNSPKQVTIEGVTDGTRKFLAGHRR